MTNGVKVIVMARDGNVWEGEGDSCSMENKVGPFDVLGEHAQIGIFHDYNFDESPLATWAVGGFLGPEEGSYAFCHGLHSNNGVLSIYNSEDAFSGIKVEGFTTSWSAAKLANTYGYSAGYTGPSATIRTDLGQNNGPGSKSGKLNWHR